MSLEETSNMGSAELTVSNVVSLLDFSWERMAAAVEAVRERAQRVTVALQQAGIPHVIVGGNAVASWVARVDREAVRNTKDVDLLVRRADFAMIVGLLESVGFVHQQVNGIDLFLDGPEGSVRSGIHVLFADEKIRDDDLLPSPSVTECEAGPGFPVPTLEALVRMKLTAFRLKDQVHLQDLLEVGLIDAGWRQLLPATLADRLQSVIDSRQREA